MIQRGKVYADASGHRTKLITSVIGRTVFYIRFLQRFGSTRTLGGGHSTVKNFAQWAHRVHNPPHHQRDSR